MPSYYDCFQKVLYHYSYQTRKIQTFFSKEKGSDFLFLAACPAAQQKHPQRMAGLLQLRRSALRMLIFYAAPSLLMGKSGHRLRFDVICRNTPAFLAPLCRATVEQSETERFYPASLR